MKTNRLAVLKTRPAPALRQGFFDDNPRGQKLKTVSNNVTEILKRNPYLFHAAGLYPPFRTLSEKIECERLKLAGKKTKAEYEMAAQTMSMAAADFEHKTGMALGKVWEESRFEKKAQDGLAMGLQFALAGATLGSAVPGIGTLVGAVGGFIVGFFLGLFPFEKQAALETFVAMVKPLKPIERYMLLASLRQWADDARRKMELSIWPAWRIGDQGGILKLHTIVQGEDVLVLFFLEALLMHTAFVEDNDPAVIAYARAIVVSYTDDETVVKEMPFTGRIIAGEGGQWLAKQLQMVQTQTAKQVRDNAIALGIPDYSNRVVSPAVVDALAEAGYAER